MAIGLRKPGAQRNPVDLASSSERLQDGSVGRACPTGRIHGGRLALLAPPKRLCDAGRLHLCQRDHAGEAAVLADNLMKRHIRPIAKANGIHKRIGWNTFRRTFGTLLKANGEDVKTVQELLRHANSRITLDVYTQAVGSNKRAAQSKVVRMMVPNLGEMKGETHPQKAG